MEVIIEDRATFDFEDKSHKSAAVYIATKLDDVTKCILYGHNQKHDNLSAFGGVKDEGETVLQTVLREFEEETNGCILKNDELEELLRTQATILKKISNDGKTVVYVFIVFVPNLDVARCITNYNFVMEAYGHNLKPESKENDFLLAVTFDEILQVRSDTPEDCNDLLVHDALHNERTYMMRSVCACSSVDIAKGRYV